MSMKRAITFPRVSPVSSTLLLKVVLVNVTCGNEADLDHILFCTFVTKVYAVLVSVFTDVTNEALPAFVL